MRILVTGGTGFIGSNLVPELESRGHEVWVCDLGQSNRLRYIRADVSEYRQLVRVFAEQYFDFVYHLAAEYGRWNGEEYYENLWLTNVIGTKNLLRIQECQKFRMVFFSSAEVYGDYEGKMYEEIMDSIPIKQMNDYAMTKWVGELQVLNSMTMFNTETVRVRPVNCYGPQERYSPYRGVIPRFIHHALLDKPYTVHMGHKRIFDYVEDTCRTFANITENFIPGEVYNVGGKEEWEHDIKYVSDLILEYMGKSDLRVKYEKEEPFTTRVKQMDFSKIRRDLKHDPKVPLEEGIPLTIDWMKKVYGIK